MVGQTWDWGLPIYPDQYLDMLMNNFSVWRDDFELGRFWYFNLELLYWLTLQPFGLLGGEFTSKAAPISYLLLSGLGAYLLAIRHLNLNTSYAFLSGLLYMLSPIMYSRLVAGHLPVILGLALLPYFLLSLFNLLDQSSERPKFEGRSWRLILISGTLLGLENSHPSVGLVVVVITIITIFLSFFIGSWKKFIPRVIAVIFIASLVNLHWIAPLVHDQIEAGIIRHGWGLSAGEGTTVTNESELPGRFEYLKSTGQPVTRLLSYSARTGMDTEYIYPVNNFLLSKIQLVCSTALLFAALSAVLVLSIRRKSQLSPAPSIILGGLLLGIFLCAGYRTALGTVYYQSLQHAFPLMYNAMSNSVRWFPLLTIGVSMLAPYTFQKFEKRLFSVKISKYLPLLLTIGSCLPFLTNQLTNDIPSQKLSTQPLNLKIIKPNPHDRELFEFLSQDQDPFRIFIIPAPGVSWPGTTDHFFEWTSRYSPKNVFPTSHGSKFGSLILQNLYSANPSPALGKALGLASVKYVIVPAYEHHFSYFDYRPEEELPRFDNLKDFKLIFEKNFEKIDGLKLVKSIGDINVFENKHYRPKIFSASGVTLSESEPWFIDLEDSKNLNEVYTESLATRDLAINFRQPDVQKIKFQKINSSLYRVENFTDGILTFNEAFDEGWKLYKVKRNPECELSDSGSVLGIQLTFHQKCSEEIGQKILVNSFANSWLVSIAAQPDPSDYVYFIYHDKQTTFILILMISLTIVLSSIVILAATSFGRAKND